MLSGLEEQAMALSAELANTLHRLVAAGPSADPEFEDATMIEYDWAELAHHIHAIQRYILSNSTAREYPGKFRLLGQSLQSDSI